MPSLTVFLDDLALATVCCDSYDLVSIRLSGTRINEELASLEMSGGQYPENADSTYLFWLSEIELRAGQVVSARLTEGGTSSAPGKTIEELYPEEKPSTADSDKPLAEVYQELRTRPYRRDGYQFQLSSTQGTSYAGRTSADEHGFGFSVLWHPRNPERASVSLHSYTLDDLEQRGPMRSHVREYLNLGQSVTLKVET